MFKHFFVIIGYQWEISSIYIPIFEYFKLHFKKKLKMVISRFDLDRSTTHRNNINSDYVFRNGRFIMIADTKGSYFARKSLATKLNDFWNRFSSRITSRPKNMNKFVEKLADNLRKFEARSSFTCCFLETRNKYWYESYLLHVIQIGNCGLLSYKNEQLTDLTGFREEPDSELPDNIKNIEIRQISVKKGDVIIGMTDGVWKNISEAKLLSFMGKNLISKTFDYIKNKLEINEDYSNEERSKSVNARDNMAMFVMEI